MALIVHTAGTYSLLVDRGRPHTRSLGVPVGGAADRAALAIGNALAGNAPDAVALEFTLAGPTLEATAEHGCVVFGAAFQVWINDRAQPIGKTFNLRPGDGLTIATPTQGLRGYLCVRGGFAAKEVLASRSAFEPVQSGDTLECPAGRLRTRFAPAVSGEFAPLSATPSPSVSLRLRVVPGTHLAQFPADQFFDSEYTVRPESDRMGIRLAGRALPRPEGEQLSAPVCPGTVQITHDGQPVVLGIDAQTIGGYPRIAHVIAADLDLLAQLPPEEHILFLQTDLDQAVAAWRKRQAWLHEWVTRLQYAWV